jgi:hypothetical protein
VGNTLICRGVSRDAHQSGPEPELLSAHRLLPHTPKATYPNNTEQTDGERACFATGLRPHVVRDHERPACLAKCRTASAADQGLSPTAETPYRLWGQIYNLSPISSAYAENTTCSRRSGAGATSSYLTARKFLQRIPRDWPVSQFRILPGAQRVSAVQSRFLANRVSIECPWRALRRSVRLVSANNRWKDTSGRLARVSTGSIPVSRTSVFAGQSMFFGLPASHVHTTSTTGLG